MKIAVFDIGTNSIHLLVVEIRDDRSFEILDHEKDTTRLGDGSFENLKLSKQAMRRAFDVLERFVKIAKRNGVTRTVAVATSAVREAKNRDEFLREVKRRTGLRVRVISGEEEARLVYLAAVSSVETRGQKAMAIDIGGGSLELILGDGIRTPYLGCFKLGVARLTDRFVKSDPPSKKDLRKLERHVKEELAKTAKKLRKSGYSMVIGTAGTMISLASMVFQAEKRRPLQLVNHFELTRKGLERVHRKLLRTTLKDRLKFPGLEPKRADLIVAGSALVLALMNLLKVKKITISDKGIREGIILDYVEKLRRPAAGKDSGMGIREKSVRQLARRCASNEPHADHVAKLADRLFEETRPLHRLGDREREILRHAALLHDIGHYVSFRKHHKHTHYLIVNSDLDGFEPEEVEMIGLTARYHRKSAGDADQIQSLSRDAKDAALALGAILRVADGLDRTHSGVIESLECRLSPGAAVVTVRARRDAELELWAAAERSDLFERVFKRRLTVQLGKVRR